MPPHERVELSCTVLPIAVFITRDALYATIFLWTLLPCRQVAEITDGMINAPCFAIMMLGYLISGGVFTIVELIVSCVGYGVTGAIPAGKCILLLKTQS